jgi:hypothetical protein
MLQQRNRWNGPKTISWGQVFRDLHRAVVLSVAYKRRDSTVDWQLHGGLYELHAQDRAIAEAGISTALAVRPPYSKPTSRNRPHVRAGLALEMWRPAGANVAEWKHILWCGQWHFLVNRGPMRARPVRWACKTFPMPNSPVPGESHQPLRQSS